MNDLNIFDIFVKAVVLAIGLLPIGLLLALVIGADIKSDDVSKDKDEINTEDTDTADTADTEKTNLSLEKYDNFYKKWLSNDDDDKEEK